MRRFALKAVLVTGAMLGAGCAQLTTGAETVAQLPRMMVEGTYDFFVFIFTRAELRVEAVEVARLAQCQSTGREAYLEVFTHPDDVRAWEQARGVRFLPEGSVLPNGMYAIAEAGERVTGGYGLVVSRQAAVKDEVLYLKASFLVPGNADMVTQATTSPCSLVQLPTRLYSRAFLLDQSNKVRARWDAPKGS